MKTANKTFRAVLLIALCIVLMSTACLATGNAYAEKGAAWALDGIYWIVIVLGIWFGGMALVKRNITAGVGIFIGTALVAAISKNPSIIENLGTALKNILGL